MAFELTIDGYTFDNPPSTYRKRIALGNSPQPHYEKTATPYYRSDSQQITLELSGRLSLNDQGDLDELERIQQKAIQGGEVDVQFDPFFSGTGVIEDEPIEQENQRGRYTFSIAINEETTDTSAYPAHATPTTGNTFELGNFDFGFDPESVSQEYERQTERVDRLQGVAHTSDTKGLVTRVSLDGRVDGGGQAQLWDKARSNALAYLTAEFQNGWALLNTLSVSKDDATPDYLQGLFQYSAEFLIVKDPSSGIGETSQFINHKVGDSGTYTSDDDAGTGSDEGGLDFKVLGGTGSIDGRYVDWVTTTLTLTDNATNYVFVDDSDGDGNGTVEYNTSGFPGTDALPLYEVDTSSGEIVDVRDVRDSLLGTGDDTASDFIFRDEFSIDDTAFTYAQILAFADQVANPALIQSYLGKANFSESIADPVESGLLPAKGLTDFAETLAVQDGGSASEAGSSTETLTWGSASDWDAAVAESFVRHAGYGDGDAGTVRLGYPDQDPFGNNGLINFWHMEDDSGSLEELNPDGSSTDTASVYTGSPQYNDSGILGTASVGFDGSTYFQVANSADIGHNTGQTWVTWARFGNQDVSNPGVWEYGLRTDNGDIQFEYRDESTTKSGAARWLYNFASSGGDFFDSPQDSLPENSGFHMVAFVLDGSGNAEIYIDSGTSPVATDSYSPSDGGYDFWIGQKGGSPIVGNIAKLLKFDYALSGSQVDSLYNDIQAGSLTTGTKTFSGSVDPSSLSLENVAASLNGESITVYIESDPDGDGSFEETSDAITLDGSGGPYTVSGLSSTSADFRLRIEPSTSSITASPTFSSADLVGGTDSGDADQNPNTKWTMRGVQPDTSGHEYEGGGFVGIPAGD